jgi:hypothetical protein
VNGPAAPENPLVGRPTLSLGTSQDQGFMASAVNPFLFWLRFVCVFQNQLMIVVIVIDRHGSNKSKAKFLF